MANSASEGVNRLLVNAVRTSFGVFNFGQF